MQLAEHPSEVPVSECWRLLAGESIGRLALSVRSLPAVLPVQYYLDGDAVAICLGHHDVPYQSIDGTVAAFAVDSLDKTSSSGWAVHCLGTLRPRGRKGTPDDCGQPAAGQVVHFTPAIIAGHRVQLCPFLSM